MTTHHHSDRRHNALPAKPQATQDRPKSRRFPRILRIAGAALALALSLGAPTASQAAPETDPRSAVVSYDPGSGSAARFNDPSSALGWPSQFNPFGEPTDPFNPPYGTNQIVSIGAGGHLLVRFDTPILNHPNNHRGLDFTIFGNAGFIITNEFDLTTFDWVGTPATDGSLFGSSPAECIVSVSRDGREFFPLNPARAPRLDAFPPTDGAGDPSLTVDPSLTAADAAGATLADLRSLYEGSAGGASFDLDWALADSGAPRTLPEVRFVRIDVLQGRIEIDAVVPVARNVRR